MNSKYATPIKDVGQALASSYPGSGDPVQDALFHLAMAYYFTMRALEDGADMQVGGRPIVYPTIERAYREMAHVRLSARAYKVNTTPYLTRLGRLVTDETEAPTTSG